MVTTHFDQKRKNGMNQTIVLSMYLKDADYSLFVRQYFVAGQESKGEVDVVGLDDWCIFFQPPRLL